METVETLNLRLIDYYGIEISTGQPMFRIVFANDQTEKKLVYTLDTGIALLFPEVREVKKYPYLKDMYVLERLVVVPEVDQKELPTSKLSYEPIWTFCDSARNPLPPIWDATRFIIDSLYAALGKQSMVKYIEDEEETTPEGREHRIDNLEEQLFGDETDVGDALRYKEGIVVPPNYKKES